MFFKEINISTILVNRIMRIKYMPYQLINIKLNINKKEIRIKKRKAKIIRHKDIRKGNKSFVVIFIRLTFVKKFVFLLLMVRNK